jgi:hypothetical protein
MEWVIEDQTGSGILLRFDADKLAAIELLMAPVDPLCADTVHLGRELEAARRRLENHRARNCQVELGLVVFVGDGRPVASPIPERTESPFGPWLLSLGEFRLLSDALRLDPLGLWRLLLRVSPPPWKGGADLVDLLGHIRRLDESRPAMDALPQDGTEYLHQRARFMAARHPAPSPDPPGWITVSRWRGTPDPKIFVAEEGFEPFALLARAPGRFCWAVANAPVHDRYDLLAVLTYMTGFWSARLLEAGWLAAPTGLEVDVAVRILVNFDECPGAVLVVAPYRGGARVLAGRGFLDLLCKPDNEADRMLVAGLLMATRPVDAELLRQVVDHVVPAGHGTFVVWPDPEVRRVNTELDPPEIIPECERLQVGHDVAANMLKGSEVAHTAHSDAAKDVLGIVNELVVALLDHELQLCQPGILLDLIRLYERACAYREREEAALPARAALRDASEAALAGLGPSENGVALRGLIEQVAAALPDGQRVSSRAQLIRLRALAEALIEWGTIYDAMNAGLASASIAIGVGIGCVVNADGPVIAAQDKVTSRLAESAPALMLVTHRNRWGAEREQMPEPSLKDSVNFDHARWSAVDLEMRDSWGFSLGEALRALRALADHAGEADDNVAVETADAARALVRNSTGIPKARVDCLVARMTLTRHDDYNPLERDLKPWQGNRERSYLRCPLVELHDGRLAWSEVHMLQAARYFVNLVAKGQLRCDGTLRQAVSRLSTELDDDFEQVVRDACKELGWETQPYKMRKFGGKRLERTPGQDIGDVDVLAWDRGTGTAWLLDAKRISPAIVPYAMRHEAKKLEEEVEKHLSRLHWVEEHPARLLAEIRRPDSEDAWTVKAALVTDFPLVGAYLDSLQLPVWWVDDLSQHLHL